MEAVHSTPVIEAVITTLLPKAVEGIQTPPGVKDGAEAAVAAAAEVVPVEEKKEEETEVELEQKKAEKKDVETPKLEPPVDLGSVETPRQQPEEVKPAETDDVEMGDV